MKELYAWNARRIKADNRLQHLSFGPSVDEIGNSCIGHTAFAVNNAGDFVVHCQSEPDSDPHCKIIARLKGNGALSAHPIHLKQGAVWRVAVMQPGVNDHNVKRSVLIGKVLCVLPMVRHSGVEVGDPKIGKPDSSHDAFV